jgi:hypothetical protein
MQKPDKPLEKAAKKSLKNPPGAADGRRCRITILGVENPVIQPRNR